MVGMMRNGQILVQENPAKLMERFGVPNLEQVFLTLCKKDRKEDPKGLMDSSGSETRKCLKMRFR